MAGGTGRVLELEGADHGPESPDWRTSVRHHAQVAAAVRELAAEVAP